MSFGSNRVVALYPEHLERFQELLRRLSADWTADVFACTYPFALCILMNDVLPSSVTMVLAAVPPIEYVSPEGQQDLARRFRELCLQTPRPTLVYTYSLILQA